MYKRQLAKGSWGATAVGQAVGATHLQMDARRSTSCSAVLVFRRRSFLWRSSPHPFAQRRLPASDAAVAIHRSTAALFHHQVCHHVVHARVIFPGAGYMEMANAASDAVSALRGVFFLQPLVVETAGLLIECVLADSRFEVRSGADDTSADAIVHCAGALAARDGWQRADHASVRGDACGRAMHVGSLYDGFAAAGLQYGPGYRTLANAWVGGGAAAARLQSLSLIHI